MRPNPFLFSCLLGLFLLACQDPIAPVSGAYLGQPLPGSTPALFAPGIVSTGTDELNAAFSADGRELYFSRNTGGRTRIMVTREQDGTWTEPEPASFSGSFGDVDPYLNSDGSRLYFSSRRPLDDSNRAKDADLWLVLRNVGGSWGEPRPVADVNHTGVNDYYTSVQSDGTLYYSLFDSTGVADLYLARALGDGFAEPEALPSPINTPGNEHDPFIAPDGSYLIFSSNRPGGYGENDLYVSFLDDDGSWLEPRNLGPEINSPGYDYCPNVSHDGRFLFFTREIEGNGDIFWVDAGVIRESV